MSGARALSDDGPMERDLSGALQSRKIIVCVTGGIAAYKVVGLVRSLVQLEAQVQVVMTPSATHFVGPQTFAAVSGRAVISSILGESPEAPHVEAARGADLVIVAPATANSLAKMAAGLADDAVAATLVTAHCPILVAPAMHTEMWEQASTRANMATLVARGVEVIGPESGPLMSGDEGPGRMSEPEAILQRAVAMLVRAADFEGRTILVTAGGTREPIDAVRFISNRSSGAMGGEIAAAAMARGAKVVLVMGPAERPAPPGVEVVEVQTAEEMRDAVMDRVAAADIVIKAAAVSDFRPERSFREKLKKAAGLPELKLVPTPDILAELGRMRRGGEGDWVLVGFAAETETDSVELAAHARSKREAKGADIIVANDVASRDSGFGARTNRAVMAGPEGIRELGLVTKAELAETLLDVVHDLMERRGLG